MNEINRIFKLNDKDGVINVNVITFSGHGYNINGDTIAVIPEKLNDTDVKVLRFINMSGIARKLASKKNSVNIFLLSMCRVFKTDEIFHHLDYDAF